MFGDPQRTRIMGTDEQPGYFVRLRSLCNGLSTLGNVHVLELTARTNSENAQRALKVHEPEERMAT